MLLYLSPTGDEKIVKMLMDAGADASAVGTGGKYKDKRPVDLLNSTYVLLLSIRELFPTIIIIVGHTSHSETFWSHLPINILVCWFDRIFKRFSFYSAGLAAAPAHEVTPAVTPSKPAVAGRVCCISFVSSWSFLTFSLTATPLFTDPAELDPRLQVRWFSYIHFAFVIHHTIVALVASAQDCWATRRPSVSHWSKRDYSKVYRRYVYIDRHLDKSCVTSLLFLEALYCSMLIRENLLLTSFGKSATLFNAKAWWHPPSPHTRLTRIWVFAQPCFDKRKSTVWSFELTESTLLHRICTDYCMESPPLASCCACSKQQSALLTMWYILPLHFLMWSFLIGPTSHTEATSRYDNCWSSCFFRLIFSIHCSLLVLALYGSIAWQSACRTFSDWLL